MTTHGVYTLHHSKNRHGHRFIYAHSPHYTLEGVHLQNTLWQYDPNRRLRGRVLIEHNGVALLTEEVAGHSNRRIFHFNMGPVPLYYSNLNGPILLQNIFKAKQAELSGFSQTNIKMGELVIGRGLETDNGPSSDQTIHNTESLKPVRCLLHQLSSASTPFRHQMELRPHRWGESHI